MRKSVLFSNIGATILSLLLVYNTVDVAIKYSYPHTENVSNVILASTAVLIVIFIKHMDPLKKLIFEQKTNELFSDSFKGFEYKVGNNKYRFNVKDLNAVKKNQSDINSLVGKFVNKNNEMADAAGYHKALFTAMNADSIANHFYEQGKADAIKEQMAKSKNIDMNPRGTHEAVTTDSGFKIRAISGDDSSKLRIKLRK